MTIKIMVSCIQWKTRDRADEISEDYSRIMHLHRFADFGEDAIAGIAGSVL